MSTRLSHLKSFIIQKVRYFSTVQYLVNICECAIVVGVADCVIEPVIIAVLAHFKYNSLRLDVFDKISY